MSTMDLLTLIRRLRQAKEHVGLGRYALARQMETVTQVELDGHDPTLARVLLATFLDLQERHEADLDRLMKVLIDWTPRSGRRSLECTENNDIVRRG
jgi:hypothetical protein